MNAALVLVQQDGKQTEIPVKRPVMVIGRKTDCQIRIASSDVSRHHCEVSQSGGRLNIRDLGSSNGTFVNKRRVQQSELAAGDLIAIADMVLVVKLEGRPEVVDSDDALDDGQVLPTKAPSKPSTPEERTRTSSTPPKRQGLLDDDNDGSSVGDFDFLDEDEDIKKQPKL